MKIHAFKNDDVKSDTTACGIPVWTQPKNLVFRQQRAREDRRLVNCGNCQRVKW